MGGKRKNIGVGSEYVNVNPEDLNNTGQSFADSSAEERINL